jgi:hypothetical protein
MLKYNHKVIAIKKIKFIVVLVKNLVTCFKMSKTKSTVERGSESVTRMGALVCTVEFIKVCFYTFRAGRYGYPHPTRGVCSRAVFQPFLVALMGGA